MRMKDEYEAMPVVKDETLTYQRGGQDERLPVGTPAWYAWLSTARAFAFRSALGTFTARKEPASNQRGGRYWRAYRKRGGQLHRAYLGKSEELTLERLRSVAAVLAGQHTVEPDKRLAHGQEQLEPATDQERFPHPATELSRPPARHSSSLPVPLTSLLGREREVAAARPLL